MATKRQIWIGAGLTLLAGGGTYLGIKAAKGNSLEEQWNTYADDLKYANDEDKQTDISMASNIYDLAKKYPGNVQTYLKTEGNVPVNTLVKDFADALKGAGTNTTLFYNTLNKIKNLYTFAFINKVYEVQFKEKLTDAILDETALTGWWNNPVLLSATAAFTFGIVPVAGAIVGLSSKLDPKITQFFAKLPEV